MILSPNDTIALLMIPSPPYDTLLLQMILSSSRLFSLPPDDTLPSR
jgi:hypothetical protein